MNYVLMPSLEHIALVKIGVMLWNLDDIKTRITNYALDLINEGILPKRIMSDDFNVSEGWLEIREKVFQKVTQLKLPKCLQEKVFGIVEPLGLELLNWIWTIHHMIMYHEHIDGEPCGLPNSACWTSVGTVDEKKSAEVLVKDMSINIADRFILACHYCLEDDVRELWNSMPERVKTLFHSEGLDYYSDKLEMFWTHYLKGDLDKLTDNIRDYMSQEMSPYKFGFALAVYVNNKAATEYFLKKLSPVEREMCLKEYDFHDYHGDVLCFLLSQMNEEEQKIFFSRLEGEYTCDILRCFLEWPFQNFFKETFETVCKLDMLPEPKFYALLEDIMVKISKGLGYKDYNYQQLLEQTWQLSPETCKEYVFRKWAEPGFVPGLLQKMANEGNIMLILKDATIQTREKIIFSHKRCIVDLMYECKWDLIKLLIEECVSSTEIMMKFKKEFTTEFKESVLEREPDAWEKFNQLMDELSNKKRGLEEGEYSRAKNPHTMEIAKNNM